MGQGCTAHAHPSVTAAWSTATRGASPRNKVPPNDLSTTATAFRKQWWQSLHHQRFERRGLPISIASATSQRCVDCHARPPLTDHGRQQERPKVYERPYPRSPTALQRFLSTDRSAPSSAGVPIWTTAGTASSSVGSFTITAAAQGSLSGCQLQFQLRQRHTHRQRRDLDGHCQCGQQDLWQRQSQLQRQHHRLRQRRHQRRRQRQR